MLQSLWIMRHGLAESEFDSDFNRALSETGERQALNVASKILLEEPELPLDMLVSPFRRTQETAQLVHQKLALPQPFVTEDMLVHYADHQLLGNFLLASQYTRLIIVSHMPIVARLCQYLSPECNIFGFQTGQAVKLSFNHQGKAEATKIITPDC